MPDSLWSPEEFLRKNSVMTLERDRLVEALAKYLADYSTLVDESLFDLMVKYAAILEVSMKARVLLREELISLRSASVSDIDEIFKDLERKIAGRVKDLWIDHKKENGDG